jgi:hypothetical protein
VFLKRVGLGERGGGMRQGKAPSATQAYRETRIENLCATFTCALCGYAAVLQVGRRHDTFDRDAVPGQINCPNDFHSLVHKTTSQTWVVKLGSHFF